MLEKVTPLILTYNEAPNIGRTLENLTWAKQIIIIDSFSNDKTLEIIADYNSIYNNIQVFQREFDDFASQCNYGLTLVNTEWVLSLDADYHLSQELIDSIHSSLTNSDQDAYFAKFRYCVFGKPLRGTLLPPRQVLYRRDRATYIQDGHAHRVSISSSHKLQYLVGYINHDDRKSLSRWLQSQDRYLLIEAHKLATTPNRELSLGDRLRKYKVIAPIIIFFYCLVLKGGILDGWRGWYYAWQRVLAEVLLAIRLIEREIQ